VAHRVCPVVQPAEPYPMARRPAVRHNALNGQNDTNGRNWPENRTRRFFKYFEFSSSELCRALGAGNFTADCAQIAAATKILGTRLKYGMKSPQIL